jgi:hypothetical protein
VKFDLANVLLLIIASGFFGGLASYVSNSIYQSDGTFREKITTTSLHWPFILLLNGILGVCGAFAIQILVLGMRFYEKAGKDDTTNVADSIFLIAICVIAGFGARSFLFRLTSVFERKIGQLDEKADKALTAVAEAHIRIDEKAERSDRIAQLTNLLHKNAPQEQLEYVAGVAKRQVEKDPSDGEFVLIAGRALATLRKFDEAIKFLTDYISHRRKSHTPDRILANIYYNRACYYCCSMTRLRRNASWWQPWSTSSSVSRSRPTSKKIAFMRVRIPT